MDSWRWTWWCADAAMWYVGVAVIVRRCLIPWALWLGRQVACWSGYTLMCGRRGDAATPTATCRCCDGVDFDGMAGRWAVVTGCTDGIGKEYALQLADRRINVALVSRNANKLRAVVHEIYKRHADAVQTRMVVADFTSSSGTVALGPTYDTVRRGLAGLDVALLINNAGLSYARPERLLDLPPCCSGDPTAADPCRDIIECNVLAIVAMCRIAMPLMVGTDDVRRDHREYQQLCDERSSLLRQPQQQPPPPPSPTTRGGVVINVSSLSAQLPTPLLAAYSASKAFVNKFSEELAAEYDGGAIGKHEPQQTPRIAVRCLMPGFVATKMSGIRPGTTGSVGWTSVPGPATYVRHSLRSLGCHCGCRLARRRPEQCNRRNGPGDKGTGPAADGTGWLAGAFAAVFDSPSSPFSIGRPGIATTGYSSHTLMVMAIDVARWMVGDGYVSKSVSWMMCRNRDRMARKHAKIVSEQQDR